MGCKSFPRELPNAAHRERRQAGAHRTGTGIILGQGDSMRPMFGPGDPVQVDFDVNEVIGDGVYLFRIGAAEFVKRLQRIPADNGTILLAISANKDYDDFVITKRMDFEVLGRVVRAWRGEDF